MSVAVAEAGTPIPPAWEFRARPGGRLERSSPSATPRPLRPGQVRLRFLAGGICGSDIGVLARLTEPESIVAPLHEVVARVVESRDERFEDGQLVVGTAHTGLASELIEEADRLIAVPAAFAIPEAIAIQPLSTVLRAVDALPPVRGRDVVVLGAGPIGLAFVHVVKRSGARSVLAVDPVRGRSELAHRYGADEFLAETGQRWSRERPPGRPRPSLVVDAVGHQPDLIGCALRAVADDGLVLGFGAAAEGDYPIPFGEMYHRRLTLSSGRTREGWVGVLDRGAAYLLEHRRDFEGYVSHRIPVDEAQRAYDLCSRPDGARVKVALVADA